MRKDRRAIAKYLFCLAILERKAFQLFRRASEKVDTPRARFYLLYVAYDSFKNSVILWELSESLAVPVVKAKDYERILGEVWKMVGSLSKGISKLEKMAKEDLLSFVDKLIGAYALTIMQLKTLRHMSKEISEAYHVDLESLEGILDLVIEDEETDTQVLMALKDLFVEKTMVGVDRPPAIRYTNPDRWSEQAVSSY